MQAARSLAPAACRSPLAARCPLPVARCPSPVARRPSPAARGAAASCLVAGHAAGSGPRAASQ
ncbi:hypothetical protein C6Q09_13460 [Burkholderia multivorans]|nr:hypothetical protein C6Q09_13460 [Burkholderia multivorans]